MTDDEPLTKAVVKGSSGAKATEKGGAGPPSFETMSLAQLKAWKSEERKRKREERQRVRTAEEALRQKIGRRLTPVSIFHWFFCSAVLHWHIVR
jgi:hypothetical protein